MEIAKLALEAVNTVAIVTGAIVAIVGVNTWKKELAGKVEYELARRYLKSVYKVREAIKFVRNPFIPVDEISIALKESGLEEADYSDHERSNRAVYSKRWKKVTEASTDLNVELIEAEVSWGKEAVEVSKGLTDQVNKLFVALKMFLEVREIKHDRGIIYEGYDANDVFNQDLEKAIKKIESYVRPHLK